MNHIYYSYNFLDKLSENFPEITIGKLDEDLQIVFSIIDTIKEFQKLRGINEKDTESMKLKEFCELGRKIEKALNEVLKEVN